MRPMWRLGINALSGRRSRTVLLVLAVALSTALVAAVGCALASLHAGMERRVLATLGRADIRIREVAGQMLEPSLLAAIESRPEVEVAAPRGRGSVTLRHSLGGETWTSVGVGIDPAREYRMTDPPLAKGRRVEADGEVVLSPDLSEILKAGPGDVVDVVRFGRALQLKVVGVSERGEADVVKRTEATTTRATLADITGVRDRLNEIAVALRPGNDAAAAAEAMQHAVPKNIAVQTTARVTSGIDRALVASNIGFVVASTLVSIAAGLIVLTGLTTNILERQRELSIMRAIGAERGMLARAQLMVGALIGGMGAMVGVPLGVFLAWVMAQIFPDKLPAGLVLNVPRLAWAGGASVLAGLIGAAWPAIAAARATPLSGMTRRARPATARGVAMVTAIGVVMIIGQLLVVGLPRDGNVVFWGHITVGMPLMLGGYFLLSVGVAAMIATLAGPVVAIVLRIPRAMLVGTFRSRPYRNGFTAAALMLGVAMMTDLWTVGGGLMRDWLGSIRFPDAFVNDWSGLSQEDVQRIGSLDFVDEVCPITLFKIDNRAFGLSGIQKPPTNFIAFEPEPFFRMTKLSWVAGDESYARKRLAEGGAVLVAQEFLVARAGYRIGDTFTVEHHGVQREFEVVGAVSSPGLDLVGYAFDLGREYKDVAIGAIFGTRTDLKEVFGSEAIHLIQMSYKKEITDAEAARRIREAVGRAGVLVGSGREIKEGVLVIGRNTMRMASILALVAMLICSLGVANVVLAGIDARRFEFGVLRAVGASRGLVGRLITGEVVLLVLVASILGTLLGLQASNVGVILYRLLGGITMQLRPDAGAIGLAWAMLMVVTLGVTGPLIIRLMRATARELLASTRG